MKISDQTLAVLQNFSSINPSIYIKECNTISTVSHMKTMFAKATVDEAFEKSFGVYDLNQFLSVMGIVENAHGDHQKDIRLAQRRGLDFSFSVRVLDRDRTTQCDSHLETVETEKDHPCTRAEVSPQSISHQRRLPDLGRLSVPSE